MTDIIDLSQLPAPAVVEELNYEAILSDVQAVIVAQFPAGQQDEVTATLTLESEPLTKLAQSWAYRELTLRQRINDAAKAVMLAFASDTDLDQLVAGTNTKRLEISPGDPDAVPPVEPVYESNDALRKRALLAWSRLSVAGPEGAYLYHALSASADVLDVSATSPREGVVLITVLGQNGAPEEGTLDAVLTALSADDVRPLTDKVEVQPAQILPYEIAAVLTVLPGPDSSVVLAAAQAAAEELASTNFRIGRDVTLSAVYAALHQAGVHNVQLESPTESLIVSQTQAPRCTQILISIGGRSE